MNGLTERSLRVEVDRLAAAVPGFGGVLDRHGYPPLWRREGTFSTLVLLILEQQVSLASARAAHGRLLDRIEPNPVAFLELDDAELREIGFSRQKTRYGREAAARLLDGRLDLDALEGASDDLVMAALTEVPGIGPWTAGVWLTMVLCRPDAWPPGDVALQTAAGEVFGLPERPDRAALDAMAEEWRPRRGAASRLLWHHYLSTRRRPPDPPV